jgi:hypothetical protein
MELENAIMMCVHCGEPAIAICERCGEPYCEDCKAEYNQFTQIDYDCCDRCAKTREE